MTGELIPRQQSAAVAAYDLETAARLAALDAVSDQHAAALRPPNTTRAYGADWRAWLEFTAAKELPATAATRGTLRAFVAWLWDRGAAPTTIDRRLAGVVVTLRREHRVTVSPDDTSAARELLKDYGRRAAAEQQAPRGRGQAAPLLLPDLRRISAACPTDEKGELTLVGKRDRALVLLAFAIAGRRSEVAGLMVRDVQDDPNGLVVEVRVSKTKPRTVAVPYGSNPLTCPVRAWRAWVEAAGLDDPDGPAFRRVDRHGRLLGGLSGQAAGEVVTRAGERAGVEARLTGHSVRAGLATAARKAGKDRKAIAATTGHVPNSAVLDRYIRSVDRWDGDDNALIGIGL
ncbi:MAG TPA: site-specific integrase [Streptosporangiaceae bacterium]|nr:site-specific integrase [Streptosporangiaceae bacterium]